MDLCSLKLSTHLMDPLPGSSGNTAMHHARAVVASPFWKSFLSVMWCHAVVGYRVLSFRSLHLWGAGSITGLERQRRMHSWGHRPRDKVHWCWHQLGSLLKSNHISTRDGSMLGKEGCFHNQKWHLLECFICACFALEHSRRGIFKWVKNHPRFPSTVTLMHIFFFPPRPR